MVSDSSLSGSFNPVNSMSCSSSIASLAAAVQSHFAQPATDPDQLPLGDAVMTLTGSLDQPNEPASMDPLQLPDGDAKLSPGRSLLSVLGDAARSDMVSLLPSQLPAQAGDAESSGLLLQPPERSANRPGNSGCLPVEAMFFSEPAPHEDAIGPRFEPVWAKEIGGRVRKGFNSETLTRAYPRPGHHFCQVPVWSDSADVFTRLFGTTPGRYRDTRSLDDQLCKLQADQLDTLGPVYELTTLLGGACRLPIQQEVAALSALAFSQAGNINQITRLRRKKVLELFLHRSVCPKELLSAFEAEILNSPSDGELFTDQMVQYLKDFLRKIVEQRSQEEQLTQLLSRARTSSRSASATQGRSAGKRRRKTKRGTSNTGRKKRRLSERPNSSKRRPQPFRGDGTRGATTRPDNSYSGSKKPAPERKAKNRYVNPLFKQMGTDNSESENFKRCRIWFESKVLKQPRCPEAQIPTQPDSSHLGSRNYLSRARPPVQGSNQGGGLHLRHDPITNLLNKEELRRGLQVHSEPKAAEQPHVDRKLQNGKPQECSGPRRAKWLDGQSRFKRRLLRGPYGSREPKVPDVSLARNSLLFPQDAKWVQPSPPRVHQASEACGGRFASSSHSNMLLSRRYIPSRGHRIEHDSRPRLCEGASHVSRLRLERRKIVLSPRAALRVSRFHDRLSGNDPVCPREKAQSSSRHGQKNDRLGLGPISERSGQSSGFSTGSRSSNSHSTPSLQGIAAAEDSSFEINQKLQHSSSARTRGSQGAIMVARLPVRRKTSCHSAKAGRPGCAYRDLYRQLAGHVGRFLLRRRSARQVGSQLKGHAHKRAGNFSSSESSSVFHQEPEGPDHCPPCRQQDGPLIPEKNGGNSKSPPQSGGFGNLVMVTSEKPGPCTPVHSNQGKSSSGPAVPLPPSKEGVVSEPPGVRIVNHFVGSTNDRSVCVKSERQNEPVFLVGTRDGGNGSGCSKQPKFVAQQNAIVRVSTREPDCQDPPENGGPEGSQIDPCRSRVEDAAVVPANSGEISGPPEVPPVQGGPNSRSKRESASSAASKQPATSGMAGFLRRVRKEGFSTKAAEYMRLRWRKGSRRTYESYWRNWVRWCNRGKIDPISPSPAQLGDYLVHLFHDKELATSSIGIARSAISCFSAPVEGVPLGEHRRISDLMKAFKNCRPPKARYSTTWSIDSLLSFWDTQPENSLLSLKLLTLKTVSLVAIGSLSRADELANILRENYSESDNGVNFLLAKAPKNHKHGPFPPISIEYIRGRPNICPVVAVFEYMTRTQASREVIDEHQRDRLFLSLDSRHCNVKVGTISRWLQQAMQLAGVDTSTFKAHSIRGASVSTLKQRGCTIQRIMKMGRWKSNSVLSRFYLRTLPRYLSLRKGHC